MNRNSTFPANVRSLTAIPVAQKAPAVRVHADHAAPCQELAGTSIATRMVPGFQVFEKQYTGGSTLPRHCHDDAYLIYGLEGAYTESYDSSGSVVCAPGVLRYLPPRQEHANVFENGARCLVVAVGREMLHRVGRQYLAAPDRPGRDSRRHFRVAERGDFIMNSQQDDPLLTTQCRSREFYWKSWPRGHAIRARRIHRRPRRDGCAWLANTLSRTSCAR